MENQRRQDSTEKDTQQAQRVGLAVEVLSGLAEKHVAVVKMTATLATEFLKIQALFKARQSEDDLSLAEFFWTIIFLQEAAMAFNKEFSSFLSSGFVVAMEDPVTVAPFETLIKRARSSAKKETRTEQT